MKTKSKKHRKRIIPGIYILLFIFLLISGSLKSQIEKIPLILTEDDKTFSPYFFVPSEKSDIDQLPLKSTSAEVRITGNIADVKVTQIYSNESSKTLEAIYIFPASTRAAVYKMKMQIGERTIDAVIEERDKARQIYQEAKENGKAASLLEQERPNVFRMNVSNIMMGEEIIVELFYTEFIIPEKGIYEFVYPTVVGPRYSNSGEEEWVANPYTREGEDPFYAFSLKVEIGGSIPVKEIHSPSHEIDITWLDRPPAVIGLKDDGKASGNRDFILQYRLAGNRIGSGITLYEGPDESYFMAVLEPPRRILNEDILPGEYVFIVDVSGSMHGFPLEVSKKLLRDLIGNLKTGDRFNVLLFAGGSELLAPESVAANDENILEAIDFIDNQHGGGGTEILPALRRALSLNTKSEYARSFIIVTDGYVNVEREAFDLIRENLGEANVFVFGIGSAVNRYIIEGMAHTGNGIPFIVTKHSEAPEVSEKFREYIKYPLMTDVSISFSDMEVYDMEPSSIPDLLSERPVIVTGKYRGDAGGNVLIKGNAAGKEYEKMITVSKDLISEKNKAIRYIWARERIRLLDDYSSTGWEDARHREEMVKLGLTYNLLTRYTSFIAVDRKRNDINGKVVTVKQPLPLPLGVSDHAVGTGAYSVGAVHAGNGHKWNNRSKLMKQSGLAEDISVKYKNRERDLIIISEVQEKPEFNVSGLSLRQFLTSKMPINKFSGRGTVWVKCTITKDGSVNDVVIYSGIEESINREAIRIVRLTNRKWIPGSNYKIPVDTEVLIPVIF